MQNEQRKPRSAQELRQAAVELMNKREQEDQEVLGVRIVHPGFTLNGTKDPVQRLRRLHESRLNLSMKVLEILDQLSCINHEIDELQEGREAHE